MVKSVVLVKTACQNNACFISDSQLTRSTGAKEKVSLSLNNYYRVYSSVQSVETARWFNCNKMFQDSLQLCSWKKNARSWIAWHCKPFPRCIELHYCCIDTNGTHVRVHVLTAKFFMCAHIISLSTNCWFVFDSKERKEYIQTMS